MGSCARIHGRHNVVLYVALVVLLTPTNIEGQSSSSTAIVTIALSDTPGTVELRFHFTRSNVAQEALLVTSVNFAGGDPKRVEGVQASGLGPYSSHFTGWFVVQQQSQELWVGTTLPPGKAEGNLVFSVPGLLARAPGHAPKYVISYSSSSSTLSDLCSGSTSVVYASITKLTVETSDWAEVLDSESSGWNRAQSRAYDVDLSAVESNTVHLTLLQVSNRIGDWLQTALAPFAAGVTSLMLLFVVTLQISGAPRPYHRVLVGVLTVASFIVLAMLGGWWPLDIQKMFFEAPVILGLFVCGIGLSLLPTRWHSFICELVEQLRSHGRTS